MNGVHQQLLDYITEKTKEGVPASYLKKVLLENDWTEQDIDLAFTELLNNMQGATYVSTDTETVSTDPFEREHITMDKIIDKFIPIAGALLLVVGLGYLIYANAWVHLSMEIRLGLGFFLSLVIIGGSFSLAEKMRYFTDIGIGSGVLLLYGTLIYGSRASEIASALIPEIVTLFTAVLFTLAVAYFASKRKSKVILILGMVGAYITPFVIGQNDVWVDNVSFNAYLIYFFAINLSVFLIGREISVREIIPLNLIGMFIGVSTLWNLAASEGVNAVQSSNFFTSEIFTAILFTGLVIFSILSILLSAKQFKQKDDGFLSLGYIVPVIWFAFNISNLNSVSDIITGILFIIIAATCFVGWHTLRDEETKFQHTALYASGLISAALALFAFFEEFNVITSILIAYASLFFGFLNIVGERKMERFLSYILVSLTGSILSIYHILEADLQFETVLIIIALLPAMSARLIAHYAGQEKLFPLATAYSIVWSVIAFLFVLADLLDYIDFDFLVFYLIPLTVLSYVAFVQKTAPDSISHAAKSLMLRIPLVWFAIGFLATFLELVISVYPAPTNTYLFTNTSLPTDWTLINGIFATLILFIGLYISRKLQLEQVIKRPSFILVIFGFATLLLTGNYIISAIANDLNVSLESGGARAIATTLWWAAIAIFMLYKGIKLGKKYHAEKLLGLLLLGITVFKVIIYDISTMDMQNKIIVLMMVGGAMLIFSYFVRSKNMLQTPETHSVE